MKHWSRAWKVDLIVAHNPEWTTFTKPCCKPAGNMDARIKSGHDECR